VHEEDQFYLQIVLYYLIEIKEMLVFCYLLINLRDNNSNSNGANKLLNLLDVACSIKNKYSLKEEKRFIVNLELLLFVFVDH
jgi:hypothetical protein